jgi:MFS family permease
MPAPPSRFSRDFYLVTGANFIFFLNFASFFLLPLHLKASGASEETIGYVMGTAGFAGLCVLPFLGSLLDHIGRRRFVVGGTLAMALASFAYLLVREIGPALFALRVIQGVSFTFAFVTASTLAVQLAPPGRRGQALGIFGISTLTTHAIAPALGEMVARRLGFDALFALAGSLGLVAAVLALRIRVPRSVSLSAVTVPSGGPSLRSDPALWLFAATMVACGMGFGAVLTFTPTFVHTIGLERVAPFFMAYTGAAVAVRLALGSLSDRLGRRRVLVPSMLVLAVGVLALGSVASMPALIGVGLLFGAGQGMTYPTANALMVDLSHAGNLGRVQTLFSGSFSVGVAASGFVFGRIIERFGYRTMFSGAAACVALGLVLLWLAPESARLEEAAGEAVGGRRASAS